MGPRRNRSSSYERHHRRHVGRRDCHQQRRTPSRDSADRRIVEELVLEAISLYKSGRRIVHKQTVLPQMREEPFADGVSRPVFFASCRPQQVEETEYSSSSKGLFVDLMASVPCLFVTRSAAERREIIANMVVSIRRHQELFGHKVSLNFSLVEPWAWDLLKEEVPLGNTESDATCRVRRCERWMAKLRRIAVKVGHPEIYVATEAYHPGEAKLRMPSAITAGGIDHKERELRRQQRSVKTNESSRGRRNDEKRCGRKRASSEREPADPSPSRPPSRSPSVGNSKSQWKDAEYNQLGHWYKKKELASQDPVTAINTIVQKIHLLRKDGCLPSHAVTMPPPIALVDMANGDSIEAYNCIGQVRKMETKEYFSLTAFVVDFMSAVVRILTAGSKFEIRWWISGILCAIQQLSCVGKPEHADILKEMADWTWKFASVNPFNLQFASGNGYRMHLERCDRYLDDVRERFASRLLRKASVQIVLNSYYPPGSKWRAAVSAEVVDGRAPAASIHRSLLAKYPVFLTRKDPIGTPSWQQSTSNQQSLLKIRAARSSAAGEKRRRHEDALSSFVTKGKARRVTDDDRDSSSEVLELDDEGAIEPLVIPPPPSLRSFIEKEVVKDGMMNSANVSNAADETIIRGRKPSAAVADAGEAVGTPPQQALVSECSKRPPSPDPGVLMDDTGSSSMSDASSLDAYVGAVYCGAMRRALERANIHRCHFPRHADVFGRLELHATVLFRQNTLEDLRETVSKILEDRCVQKIRDLYKTVLEQRLAPLSRNDKDELQASLDAFKDLLAKSQLIACDDAEGSH